MAEYRIVGAEVVNTENDCLMRDVCVSGGCFQQNVKKDAEVIDGTGLLLVPGFLDIHSHGCAGVDVNAVTPENIDTICDFIASKGVSGQLLSILTDTKEKTLECIHVIVDAMKTHPQIMGIHLEGPFLAKEYKGAMPEYLLQKGNAALLHEYQQAAEGNIRYITISPEIDGAFEVIRQARRDNIVVAIGHSGADYETAMHAINSGARGITHTFNAMKLLHQHFPAILGAALESDAYCEMICDGRHLHPAIVRLLFKCKGVERLVAVTDSIMAAGLPDGEYKLGVNDVTVKDGDATLTENGVRAGSTLSSVQALKNIIAFTGRDMQEVLPVLTSNPAALLNMDNKGAIMDGMDADCVLMDENFNVKFTMSKGVIVYNNL